MNIRGNDGLIREFIPAQPGKFYNFTNMNMKSNHGSESGTPAYCQHCRETFGYRSLMEQKEELRSHTCNRLYNQENNTKRLESFNKNY